MILFAYYFVISQAGKWKEKRTAKGVFSTNFEGCNKGSELCFGACLEWVQMRMKGSVKY